MNSFFAEAIQFKSFQQTFSYQILIIYQGINDQMQRFTSNLKLYLNQIIIKYLIQIFKSQKNYTKKACQLIINDQNSIINWAGDNHEEVIKFFDQELIFNSKHKLSLFCKAEGLMMLGQYNEAMIWADRALEVDPKHCDSLYSKANSLIYVNLNDKFVRMRAQFIEAIILADKAMKVYPNHCNSLFCKGSSLASLKMFKKDIQLFEQSLLVNPDHFYSLGGKGYCLQQRNILGFIAIIKQILKSLNIL